MPQCRDARLSFLLLAAVAALASALRQADEKCITAVTQSLGDLDDSPRAQLRQAFQAIARSQLYGRPLQIQEHLEKRAYDILSAVDQCGASTPAVPCLFDATLATPPRDRRIFIAANLHNNAALMPHFIPQLLLSVVSLPYRDTFVSLYESGSTDATGMISSPTFGFVAVTTGPLHAYRVADMHCLVKVSFCDVGAWLKLVDRLLGLLEVPKKIVTGKLFSICKVSDTRSRAMHAERSEMALSAPCLQGQWSEQKAWTGLTFCLRCATLPLLPCSRWALI